MSVRPHKVIAGTLDKPLMIGGIEIHCYVLDDETRVLSQRGMFNALGIVRGGVSDKGGDENETRESGFPITKEKQESGEVELPSFLTRKWITPYIDDKIRVAMKSPILMEIPMGGPGYGYPATILADVCMAIIDAKNAGTASRRQDAIVNRAIALTKGFASVGIEALVDEATGYEKVREARSLARILEQYIAKELRPWVRTFPNSYYEEIYRLWERDYPPTTKNHPQFIGSLTNEFVYRCLAPGVLNELQRLNPMLSEGYRQNKHHQFLTENFGYVKLREHLAAVTVLMRISFSKEDFRHKFQQAFHGQLAFPFAEDLDLPSKTT